MRDYTVNLGDANFPSIKRVDCSATNDEVRKEFKFTQTLRDAFLTQHIDEPIRITAGDKPSLLYIVLTDASLSALNTIIQPLLGESDHVTIQVVEVSYPRTAQIP